MTARSHRDPPRGSASARLGRLLWPALAAVTLLGSGCDGANAHDDSEQTREVAPRDDERGSLTVRAVDARTGSEVRKTQLGLVRADRRTVYARGEGGAISPEPQSIRKGDLLFVVAGGYDPAIVALDGSSAPVSASLQPAAGVFVLNRPERLPPGAALRVMQTSVFHDGDWQRESSEIVWGGPTKLVTHHDVVDFPSRIAVPRGMKTRVYFEAADGGVSPAGVVARAGDELTPTYSPDVFVTLRAAIPDETARAIVLCDWGAIPRVPRVDRDDLAGRVARPIVSTVRFERGRAEMELVADCAFHVLVLRPSQCEAWYGYFSEGDEQVQLRPHRTARAASESLSASVVFPGRLDLTTVMWLRNVREFDAGCSSLDAFREAQPARGELDGTAEYTVFDAARGIAWIRGDETQRAPDDWNWHEGSVRVELPQTHRVGHVSIASDWDRAGGLLMRGSVRVLTLETQGRTSVTQRGLPTGFYRVSWNLIGPDGAVRADDSPGHRGVAFVEVSESRPEGVVTIPSTTD